MKGEKEKLSEDKLFNGIKYKYNKIANRWYQVVGHIPLAWDVWNYYNPDDIMISGSKFSGSKWRRKNNFVIHHINGDSSDDRIENLNKLTLKEHGQNHQQDPTNKKENIIRVYREEHIKKYPERSVGGKVKRTKLKDSFARMSPSELKEYVLRYIYNGK